VLNRKTALPVDAILPELLATVARHSSVVLQAEPGAGKTTRIPAALLAAVAGEVLVLEPRRIAARLAARRVAWEMGEPVGETVGYQVRFEEVGGPRTRLRFVTEGILTRRLLSDPELKGVDAVVLDEFHERHLEGDLALALLRRLQCLRRELKLVVMSATLDALPVAEFLDGAPVLRAEGRRFELEIRHLPYSPLPLEAQVRGAVELLAANAQRLSENSDSKDSDLQIQGHTLVFLPGVAEIRRAMRECEPLARRLGWLMLPLHGTLAPRDQDRALEPSTQPKLIMATNVAESSVTVEGTSAVIDSGLVRVASWSPWSGLPSLHIGKISKASARQRAGRAGRTGAGRVVRLYAEEDFSRRAEYDAPEIVRSDLSQLCLELRAMGLRAGELEWLDAPPDAALEHAEALLDSLGASGTKAVRLARYPLPPRLGRIVVEAVERGVAEQGCVAAAVLGSGAPSAANDLLTAMEGELDARTRKHTEQLRRIVSKGERIPRLPKEGRHGAPSAHGALDDALLISVLAGFPDRVARRRAGKQLLLSAGGSAETAGSAPGYEFMVAVDAEDRRELPLPLVRMTARIEPEWLLDLFPSHVRERSEVRWNDKAERVDAVSELLYDELVIEESRGAAPDAELAAELLASKALEVGVERFADADALAELTARAEFAGSDPARIKECIQQALRELCRGLRGFSELRRAAETLLLLVEQKLGGRGLDELAPARLRLQGGRQTRVHYERGKPPWIASRLQDFFGMKETPRIGPQRTPVVVHLLAPNQRAVQTTSDLAGFWERLYPQVRRELMRRYPRHQWPERP
jgi:ATP-dependent helicase HrpB